MSAEPGTLVFIALGSNLGDAKQNVLRALAALQKLSRRPLQRSSLWRSTPVDCPPGSPDFINAAAAMVPIAGETPETLLMQLQAIEKQFGRAPKSVHNEARPLDLDIISFGDEVRNTPELTIPHPRAHLRRFVLEPLAEIAPELLLPGRTRTVSQMLEQLVSSERLERINTSELN